MATQDTKTKKSDQQMGKKCSACSCLNHFARVCISVGHARVQNQNSKQQRETRHVREDKNEDDNDNESFSSTDTSNIRSVSSSTSKVMLTTTINNLDADMLYDPGAALGEN